MNDLREWLTDRIDGSEETRGEDSLISGFISQIDAQDAELADLKQRLLPQYVGRAERAEKQRQMAVVERDEMLEKLRAATTMPCAPSATAAPGTEPRGCPTPGACSCPAVRVEEGAIGHARYEYLRTLNPREFAALCNEALADERFDDLVDRRRMKGEPVDHGYDRTASLNAGKYVCTCGACSHYTTKEQP